ncbi:hypothetical protein KG829_004702 [Salmonella enterica]|nr:hypothetical protein [Salmonella enterica]EBA6265860.1 hypothetical protein [Salmonella enterica]EBH4418498.1 hypothetical protein [Salmonella enterica]EHM8868771.1 hypothetical protein [Salmonella enterica]EHM9142106.1 hypothetical protein [Salmonella enterica]
MKIVVQKDEIMPGVIRKYIKFSHEPLEQISWLSTFISGCSLILAGVTLLLNQMLFYLLCYPSLAGLSCACYQEPYITPEASEKMTKVRKQNDTRNQTPYPHLS